MNFPIKKVFALLFVFDCVLDAPTERKPIIGATDSVRFNPIWKEKVNHILSRTHNQTKIGETNRFHSTLTSLYFCSFVCFANCLLDVIYLWLMWKVLAFPCCAIHHRHKNTQNQKRNSFFSSFSKNRQTKHKTRSRDRIASSLWQWETMKKTAFRFLLCCCWNYRFSISRKLWKSSIVEHPRRDERYDST